MKLKRFLKTIFMTEFIIGLSVAIKEVFKKKKTIIRMKTASAQRKLQGLD